MSLPRVIFALLYRLGKLLLLSVGVLPGLILFAPVFVASKLISIKKAREALAGSSVKIQGRDVIATWKILVALVAAPTLYHFYSIILTWKAYQDNMWGYLPEWVPLWLVYFGMWPVMIGMTFAGLRFGEVGMDIAKSLRPLVMCLSPSSSYNIQQLRATRAELSEKVTNLILTLGPEMFPEDFEKFARMAQGREGAVPESPKSERGEPGRPRRDSEQSFVSELETQTPPKLSRHNTQPSSRALPRNDSFSNIGGVGMFSTRPPSRARSRSNSAGGGGFPISGFTALDTAESLDEASRKIRDAMRQRRRNSSVFSLTSSAAAEDKDNGSSRQGDDSEEEGYDEARKKNS